MCKVAHALILLALAAVALAGAITRPRPLSQPPPEYKDKANEGCWIYEISKFLMIGETASDPKECLGYKCFKDYVEIYSCMPIPPAQGCRIVEDHSKLYPDCCPKWVCP